MVSESSSLKIGSTGGESTHVLTTSEIPSHNHTINITSGSSNANTSSAGSHNHTYSGTTVSSGAHTHNPDGNTSHKPMQLSGFDNSFYKNGDTVAFYYTRKSDQNDGTITTSSSGAHTHTFSGTVVSNGAHTHTLNNHTHSISGTTSSVGSGSAHNNMQPYVVVARWHRTA